MVLITAVVIVCIFLPYFPGEYDSFAVTLSTITQLVVMAALLWVPPGIIWLVYEWKRWRKRNNSDAGIPKTFTRLSIFIAFLVVAAAALGAFISYTVSVAITILVTGAFILFRVIAGRALTQHTASKRFNTAPFYLVCIPVITFTLRSLLLPPAVSFSRNYAIRQSQLLIADIESYYSKQGHYPVSLRSVWEDYKPSVKGIKRYHYELNGKSYNLFFEQFSQHLTVREIVMYNKLDEQEMYSHNQDLLLLPGDNTQRGYFTSQPLPQAHWKYFWFD